MKKVILFLMLISLAGVATVSAQDLTIPQPSTKQTIIQGFGLGQITVVYSRPNVKGRKIFGLTEPYGLVWRTGANNATTIQFSDDVTIEGKPVPAGTYGLFSVPGETEWTFILNKTAKQWGAYNYDAAQDLIRFKVPRLKSDKLVETMNMEFTNATNTDCTLRMEWENTAAELHFKIDIDAQVMANIDKAMQGEKKPYYFASIYYYNHDKDMAKALGWINEADKASPNSFNIKYWRARILLKTGDKKGAIASANEGLKIATDNNNAEYIRLNKEVIAQAQ